MNKKCSKIVIAVLLVIEFCFIFLSVKSYANKNVEEIQEVSEVDKNMFAMYIENDVGNYEEATDNGVFPEGYILNLEMTSCIDNKGNSVEDILTSIDDKVMVKSNKTIFCYLYFDKDKSVYAKVVSDYTNNTGAKLLAGTESNAYPVYYYNGNITNNNILYGDICWKMVMTTETGGVKLIYNGVPTEAEDGTKTCNNTGSASQLTSTKAFNSSYNSPAYVGYMYNTGYKYSSTGYTTSTSVYTNTRMYSSNLYYYGDKAVWNETTQQYDLKLLSDEGDIDVTETTTWSSDTYTDLIGKYTCMSTTLTSCETVHYVAGGTSSYMYNYGISNNTTKDDYKIKLATSVTDNGDGTYTLVDPIEVSKADWYTSYSNYKNYYYCSDLTSDTCGNDVIMYYSTSNNAYQLLGINIKNVYKYGNSFEPGETEGTYKLVDTIEFWDWSTNYNQINNNHYTCFNTSGECTDLKYIYYTNSSTALYITLKDGKSVEDAINEMLHADDVNKTDSTIKDYIDTWYEGAILDKTDGNGVLYSSYLENTIFCNNREITNLGGWNPNGGSTSSGYSMIFNYNTLECANKTDQFTLKVDKGGTEGYGNNALDYPVGLLTYKEASLATGTGYLKSGNYYWLLSTHSFYFSGASVGGVYSSGGLSGNVVSIANGVRPAVSLSSSVEITSGDGSVNSPYQVILPS